MVKTVLYFEVQMCPPAQLKCVKNISVDEHNCLQSCEGLFITGYDRRGFNDVQKWKILSKISKEYSDYKANKSIEYKSYVYENGYDFHGETASIIKVNW